jgi:general secretion pathway protein A
VLAGASGVGKTLLVEFLKTTLDSAVTPMVHLVFPRMEPEELLAYLADELQGVEPSGGTPATHQSVRRIRDFLAKNAERGRHALVLIDEAHLIDDAARLETLRMLLNFECDGRPTITLLLVGQPGLLTALERTPQLEERLDVKCLLRPFAPAETAAYVEHRLRVAGAGKSVFADEALEIVHEFSRGVPRRINRLCDLALLIGYAEELDSISPAHLQSVQQELVTVTCE